MTEPMVADELPRPTATRRWLAPLLLLGPIWLGTAAAAPMAGFAILGAAWGGGATGALIALLCGLLFLTLVIGLASYPGRAMIRTGDSWRGRFRWAAGVCLLGTVGLLAGFYLQHLDPAPFGSGLARIRLAGVPYVLAAAALSRPRGLRVGARGTFGILMVLVLVGFATTTHAAAGQGQQRQAQPAPVSVIPRRLMLVGNTPTGYKPVAGQVSSGQGPDTPFLADYTCVTDCPAQPSPGQAASIMFSATDESGPGDFSSYTSMCGPGSTQGYVCTALGTDMWRAVPPSSPLAYQVIIYEHDEIEFVLQAPRTMDPQLLQAYMQSIHPASNAELASFLEGYPDYS